MHWLDITILIALGIGAVFGFWSGLLWQIARVVSLLLSLYVAILFNTPSSEWISKQWLDAGPVLCCIVAFVAVFLSVYVMLYLITQILHKVIKATRLELLDRILGALLGMAKMGVIVSCICATLAAVALPITQTWMEQSTLAPPFARGTDTMIHWIPLSYRERVDENIQQTRDQVQKKVADTALDALKNEAGFK